jgi:prepilin-type N-terminal cleavage/methylation domain-containing protein
MGTRCRRGFTLVEIIVSMALTGIVITMAGAITHAVLDRSALARESRRVWDQDWIWRRWLEERFRGLEVGTDSLASFRGWEDSVAFTADVPSAMGWTELRRLSVGVVDGRLLGITDGAHTDTLMYKVSKVSFGYLTLYGERAEWLSRWISPATAPLAVRLIVTSGAGKVDTLLLRIGQRG